MKKMINLPAFVNDEENHQTEKSTESSSDAYAGHNVVSLVKFDLEQFSFAECRRLLWDRRLNLWGFHRRRRRTRRASGVATHAPNPDPWKQ